MKYLAVLGRQPKISLAELESLFVNVRPIGAELAEFESDKTPDIRRLGGTQKISVKIDGSFQDFLKSLPMAGKLTIGVSDYSRGATAFKAQGEALKIKRILTKLGHSVRVVPNKTAALSSATSFHNRLFAENKIELIKVGKDFYRVIGVQNIDAYVKRDQARPARDAKVGMLPPKLAQILINLCGDLPAGTRLLDPFCGTGVVLQEAMLMGYMPYGTDLSERMVEYSRKNLEWLLHSLACEGRHCRDTVSLSESSPAGRDSDPAQPDSQYLGQLTTPSTRQENAADVPGSLARTSAASRQNSKILSTRGEEEEASACNDRPEELRFSEEKMGQILTSIDVTQGDATNFQWQPPINAVACEGYLGRPMSLPPAEIKLKQEKQECGSIVLGFLKNLASQIQEGTPVVIAVPAWLRPNGEYERLNLLDEIKNLGYNVKSFRNLGQEDLLYHRDQQVVAREIIVLRKK